MDEIRWSLYPRVAVHHHARNWVDIQRKLLRASKTVDAYARGLDDYLRLCEERDLPVEQATKSQIASYVEDMATRVHRSRASRKTIKAGLANRTILQRLTAVRLFYDYLMETGVRDTNPVGRGRYTPGTGFYGFRQRGLVRSYQRLPWIPSDHEWERFLREVLAASLRNQLMVSLAYDGALRRSELLSLSLADIDFSQQKITIRPEIAKCGTRRFVFYADATSDLLSAYIKHRHTVMRGCRMSRNHPLFVSESRRNLCEPLTFEMWNKIVRAVALRASLPDFTTHTFRHLRLTDLARSGLELHEIATYAGHRSLSTTLKYIHLGSQELGERVRRASRFLDDRNKADRNPVLSARERQELAFLVTKHRGRSAGPWPARSKKTLERLTHPLADVFRATAITPHLAYRATRALIVEMHQRGTSYWSWSDPQWVETVGVTVPRFLERQHSTMVTHRQAMFSVAYLLGDFTAFELFAPHGIELHTLATTVFGDAVFTAAADRVFSVLADWGYSPGTRGIARTTLAFLLLRNRSPRLEDLTLELLTSLHERIETRCRLPQLYAISRALAHLQFIPAPISRGRPKPPLHERIDTTGVPQEWVDWCLAWHEQALCSERTRKQSLYMLLQIGRWLAQSHPAVTGPEHWDYDIAADFVRAVDQMKVGDWRSPNNYPEQFNRNVGKPLTPRAKASFLQRARAFFLDLQDHPLRVGKDQTMRTLQRRFNPLRALRTPPAIYRLIGPAPRTIEDKLWLKLLSAAETLQRSDLHRFQLAMYPFELVRAIAITWCLSGLRTDEIRRLRVGCVRWRIEENDTGKAGEPLPDDAICFLSVPVNKTGTAFVKPVHWLVGRRIEEWERVRPPQTLALDPKTNEIVRFLFSFRGVRIAWAYFNGHLIPMLCQKANIPMEDAIGRITAHRARSTIASALYNAPEGLTIGELGQWLGHKDFRSTQHYAKLHPTRLAKAISRANRNSRLATVLVDPAAAAKGEPAIFYYLGEGAYCANPAWAACPHRMACLKCPMYVPPGTGKLIEARDGVLRLLQEIPLTDEEKAVAEGDVQALNRYIEKRREIPAPKLPSDRYAYNRAAQTG